MAYVTYRTTHNPRQKQTIGDAVALVLKQYPHLRFVAVVPRILTIYGTMPERYEVTEADVILSDDHK